MHIALNGWFWDQPHVGSGQYLRQLVKQFGRMNDELTISLIVPPHISQPDDVPDTVNVVTTGNRARSNNLQKVWFEQRTVPQMTGKVGADLLHVPYWGPPLSSPVPIVTSLLDIIPLLYPEYVMSVGGRLYSELVRTAVRGAHHLITISQTSKLDIEEYLGVPSDAISVTYLAPDERYHPMMGRENDEAVREKYDLPPQFVLYLGGFLRHKRVEDLLQAYTYMTKAEGVEHPLVIAGREPEYDPPIKPDLRRIADELGVAHLVRWIGYVDEADKPSLYRLATVFAFPSEYEGFGLPPLEAMASGTPVVTSDAIIFDETLEDAAYQVDSPRTMAAAIIALILQKPFNDSMVNQGLALVTRYNWRKTANATRDVYRRVLSNIK